MLIIYISNLYNFAKNDYNRNEIYRVSKATIIFFILPKLMTVYLTAILAI